MLDAAVSTDRPENPVRYCIARVDRGGPTVMVHGALVVRSGKLEFIAIASAGRT